MNAPPAPIKTRPMMVIERRIGQPLETYLRREYVQGRRTMADIGAELGIHESTVQRYMALLGIEARFPGPRKAAV